MNNSPHNAVPPPDPPSKREDGKFTEEDYAILSVCGSCHRRIPAGQRRNILHDAQRLYLFGWHLYCPVPPGAMKYIKLYGTAEMKEKFLPTRRNEQEIPQAIRDTTPPESGA